MAKGGNKHDLLAGLKRNSPKVPDASMGIKGPSVNEGSTRKDIGKGHSLGPREA